METLPKHAPVGAAWSILQMGASRCLSKGCDKFAPFCFSVRTAARDRDHMPNAAIPPLERTKTHIFEYCRKINLGKGHHLLSSHVQEILLQLDAQEKTVLPAAIQVLVQDGSFTAHKGVTGQELELTDLGLTVVYSAP